MAKPKKNPVKLGKHRDLFGRETDVVVEDWRTLSDDELRRAAEAGALTEDDYAEMDDDEDGLDVDFIEELKALDEAAIERSAQPFIDYIRGGALSHLEYEVEAGNDGYNNIVDAFQSELENESLGRLRKAAIEALGGDSRGRARGDGEDLVQKAEDADPEKFEEVLRDPANFIIEKHSGYGAVPGTVWSYNIGEIHDQREGAEYEKELHAILHGGPSDYNNMSDGKTPVEYPGLSQAALDYALKELEDNDPWVYISGNNRRRHGGKDLKPTVDDFDKSFDLTISKHSDDSMIARYDEDALKGLLEEIAGAEPAAQPGPENDDVVYSYTGTHDSIAGASGKGMYVARLKPKDLRREGATQGICIGREENGHPKALREGRTQVFSIRTESGKPKFTIELKKQWGGQAGVPKADVLQYPSTYLFDPTEIFGEAAGPGNVWKVVEVKGKANRQPGFEAGKSTFTKPDDLRLVTDFLTSLGYTPEALRTVTDIAPGIKAAEESGMDPFAPPPRKVRPHRDPRALQAPTENPASAAVRRLLAKAKPMGTFRP